MSIDQVALYSKAQAIAAEHGMTLPANLPSLGEWVRIPGAGKNPRNTAGAVMRDIDRICLVDHSRGWSCAVFPDGSTTRKNQVSAKALYSKTGRERKAKQEQEQFESLQRLERYLARAVFCTHSPYTDRKGIKHAHGARYSQRDRCLIIELQNIDGKLQSAQRIFDNGDKRCWPKLPVAGAFHLLGEVMSGQHLLIGEGMATCWTLNEQTGLPVACAMFAGNLRPVALALRSRYPTRKITICGDDDRFTNGNPGRAKAEAAATVTGGCVVFPTFCQSCARCTDFNDMAVCQAAMSR